jgi:hypothetical protein
MLSWALTAAPNSFLRVWIGLPSWTPCSHNQAIKALKCGCQRHRFQCESIAWAIALDHEVTGGTCAVAAARFGQLGLDLDFAIAVFAFGLEITCGLDLDLLGVPMQAERCQKVDLVKSGYATQKEDFVPR